MIFGRRKGECQQRYVGITSSKSILELKLMLLSPLSSHMQKGKPAPHLELFHVESPSRLLALQRIPSNGQHAMGAEEPVCREKATGSLAGERGGRTEYPFVSTLTHPTDTSNSAMSHPATTTPRTRRPLDQMPASTRSSPHGTRRWSLGGEI